MSVPGYGGTRNASAAITRPRSCEYRRGHYPTDDPDQRAINARSRHDLAMDQDSERLPGKRRGLARVLLGRCHVAVVRRNR
jgi:hypothetical protein